jgi:ABC-2 type transport system permease protein
MRMLGAVAATVFGAGFVAIIGFNSRILVERLARVDPLAPEGLLPAMLVGGAALSVVTSLSTAFHHLFMAADEELLLAGPIPTRDLYALKLLEIWRDGIHIVLFLAAALIGYGAALRLPLPYFGTAVVLALLLTLGGTLAGMCLTLLLAHVRFGGSLLGMSRLLSILLFLPVGVLGVPALAVGRSRSFPGIGTDNLQTAAATLRELGPPPEWSPATWGMHLLLADDSAVLSGGLLLGTAAVLLVGSLYAFDRAFQPSWERVRFAAPRSIGKTGKRSGVGWTWRRSLGRLSRRPSLKATGPVLTMLQKDLRVLVRDPRWRTSLLVSLVALGVPLLLFSASTDSAGRLSPAARFWVSLFPIPYLAYVAGSQHGAASLTYEGRNLALLRAAPVGFRRLLVAKLAGSLVLVLGITWLATVVLALRHDANAVQIAIALGVATWLALGGTMSGLTGAALTADFETDNPQRRVGCLGTMLTTALAAAFFVTNTALVVWVLLRVLGGLPRPLLSVASILDWIVPALAVAAVGALVLAAQLGIRRLATWEAS